VLCARFHDKYHPEALDKRHQAITALAQQNYVAFAADHELGKLDWDSITQASLHPLDDGRGASTSLPPTHQPPPATNHHDLLRRRTALHCTAVGLELGEPEVGHLDVPLGVEQQVERLEVPVHDL
jgi:hypothetical protein